MVKDLVNLNLACIAHNHIHSPQKELQHIPFQRTTDIHSYSTRQTNNLHIPNFKTKSGQQTIQYKGSKIWNSLPTDIQNQHKLHLFKKQVKKHLTAKYKD